MTAQLNLNSEPTEVVRVEGPVIVEVSPLAGDEGSGGRVPAFAIINDVDDEGGLELGYDVGDYIKPIPLDDGEKSITVSPDRTQMTIKSSIGQTYTIRRINDSDGEWLSRYQTAVPADALEQMVMSPVEMTNETQPESLYATFDDNEEIKYLVYSNVGGVYIRSEGGWFRMPDDDESLDGLEVIEVTPEFIPAYDKNEMISRDETLSYEDQDDEDADASGDTNTEE